MPHQGSQKELISRIVTRKGFMHSLVLAFLAASFVVADAASSPRPAFAFMADTQQTDIKNSQQDSSSTTIAYRELKVNLPQFNVDVPVATWFKPDDKLIDAPKTNDSVVYSHRISVKRIGSLLAGMNFIPEFVSKEFELSPTTSVSIVYGNDLPYPSDRPVVFLAHGFLGSRFDLSHVAEELASQGFVCLSPEYPESLASSYAKMEGLDRGVINDRLLDTMQTDLGIKASSYGIIGHSLGCGTATSTGDDSWTRVCIAGPPIRRDGVEVGGNTLSIVSLNDGLITMSRLESMLPSDFVRLQENTMMNASLPKKSAIILTEPNHISFLAGNANDAMVNFLSPLLPVAQALSIPVLDFDKYQESRDSVQTASVVIPLITAYLKQYMM
jgi:hypothetical protein